MEHQVIIPSFMISPVMQHHDLFSLFPV